MPAHQMPIDYLTRPGQFAESGKTPAARHRYKRLRAPNPDILLDVGVPLLDTRLDDYADAYGDLSIYRQRCDALHEEEMS